MTTGRINQVTGTVPGWGVSLGRTPSLPRPSKVPQGDSGPLCAHTKMTGRRDCLRLGELTERSAPSPNPLARGARPTGRPPQASHTLPGESALTPDVSQDMHRACPGFRMLPESVPRPPGYAGPMQACGPLDHAPTPSPASTTSDCLARLSPRPGQ